MNYASRCETQQVPLLDLAARGPLSAHLSAAIVSVRTGQSSTSSCHYFPNSDLPRPSKYGLKSERATVDCAIVKPSLKRLTMNV